MQNKLKRLIAAMVLGAALAVGVVTIGQVAQQPTQGLVAQDPGHGGGGGGGG